MSDGLMDLADVQFVPTDAEEIRDSIITTYEAVSGKRLYPGDPVRLFLLSIADLIVHQRVYMNEAAQMNLLRYARGNYLDHLGAFVETPRLQAVPALTTVTFTLSASRPNPVLIPGGTRVSPGGNLFFATNQATEIPAGETSVNISCTCLDTGTVGNGFVPGQINVLVDPIPFVNSVSNITESSGGADVEDDDPYRERIYTSPERFSVAGPRGAYEYYARTANQDILDIHVWSPAPVEVDIRVLMQDGELPTQDILDAVYAAVNADTIRPLTDKVTVQAPTAVEYGIDLTYWIDQDNATEASQIQQQVQQAVNDYVLWQKSKISRDIMPSDLIRRIMNAGARRVAVTSPVYTKVNATEVAISQNVNVNYGGLEDD